MNTVLFVNATIGFSENLFLFVYLALLIYLNHGTLLKTKEIL